MSQHFICILLLLVPYSHSYEQSSVTYGNVAVITSSQTTQRPTTAQPTRAPTTTAPIKEDDDLASRDGRHIQANSFQVNPGPTEDQVKLRTSSGLVIVTSTPKTTFPTAKSNLTVEQSAWGNVGHRQPPSVLKVEKPTRIEYPRLAPPPQHKQVVAAEKPKQSWQPVSQPEISRIAPPSVVAQDRSKEPTHSTNNPYSRKDYYPVQDTISRRAHLDAPQQLYEAPKVSQTIDVPSNDLEPSIIVANDSSFESINVYGDIEKATIPDPASFAKSPSSSVVLTKSILVDKIDEVTTVKSYREKEKSLFEDSAKSNPKKDVHPASNDDRPSSSGSLFERGKGETAGLSYEPSKQKGIDSRKDIVSLFDDEADTKETPTSAPSLFETRDEFRRVPYVSAPQAQNAPLPPAPPPSESRNQISFSWATLDADLTEITDIGSIIESVSNNKRKPSTTGGPIPPTGPPGRPFGGALPPSPPSPVRPPSPPGNVKPPSSGSPATSTFGWSSSYSDGAPSFNTNTHTNEKEQKPLVVIYNVHPGVQQNYPVGPPTVQLPATPTGNQPSLGGNLLSPISVTSNVQQTASGQAVAPLNPAYGLSPPAPLQQKPANLPVLTPAFSTSYGVAPPAPILQQPAVGVAAPTTSFSWPGYVLQDQQQFVNTQSFSQQQANFPGGYAIPPAGSDQTRYVLTNGLPVDNAQSVVIQSEEVRSIPVVTPFRAVSPSVVAVQPQIVSLGGTLSGSPIRTVVRTRTRLADSSVRTLPSSQQQSPSSSFGSYAGRRQTTGQELNKRSSYTHQKPKSSYGVPQPPAYKPPQTGYDYYAPAPAEPPPQEPVVEDEVQQFLQPVYYQPLPSFQFTPVVGKGKKKDKEKEKEKGKFKLFGKEKKCSKHNECGGGGAGLSDEGVRGEQELKFSDPTGLFGANEQINFQYQYRGGPGEGPLQELKRVFYSGALILGALGIVPSMAMTIKSLLPVAAVAAGRRKRDLSQLSSWNGTAWKELNQMTKANISLLDALPHSGAPIPEDLRQELEPYMPSIEALEHTECLQKQFCENLLETGQLKYKENMLLFYSFLSPDAEENPWLMQSLTAARKNKCSDFYCTMRDKSRI